MWSEARYNCSRLTLGHSIGIEVYWETGGYRFRINGVTNSAKSYLTMDEAKTEGVKGAKQILSKTLVTLETLQKG